MPEQLGRHASSPPRVHGPTPRDGVRPGSGTGTQRGDTLHAPAAPAWLRPDLCSWGAPAQEPLFPPRSQRPSKRSPSPARGCHLPPLQSQLPTPCAGVGAPTASQPTGQPAFPQVHRSRAHSLWWKGAQVCPPPRAQPTQLAALALESTLAPSLSPECGEKQQEREEKLSFKCCQGLGWAEDTS